MRGNRHPDGRRTDLSKVADAPWFGIWAEPRKGIVVTSGETATRRIECETNTELATELQRVRTHAIKQNAWKGIDATHERAETVRGERRRRPVAPANHRGVRTRATRGSARLESACMQKPPEQPQGATHSNP